MGNVLGGFLGFQGPITGVFFVFFLCLGKIRAKTQVLKGKERLEMKEKGRHGINKR